jgi:hypothetical protein
MSAAFFVSADKCQAILPIPGCALYISYEVLGRFVYMRAA